VKRRIYVALLKHQREDDRKNQGKSTRHEKGHWFSHLLPSCQRKPDERFGLPVQKLDFWFDRMLLAAHKRFFLACELWIGEPFPPFPFIHRKLGVQACSGSRQLVAPVTKWHLLRNSGWTDELLPVHNNVWFLNLVRHGAIVAEKKYYFYVIDNPQQVGWKAEPHLPLRTLRSSGYAFSPKKDPRRGPASWLSTNMPAFLSCYWTRSSGCGWLANAAKRSLVFAALRDSSDSKST